MQAQHARGSTPTRPCPRPRPRPRLCPTRTLLRRRYEASQPSTGCAASRTRSYTLLLR